MRGFVVDGNFTADHIKQTRPYDDVWLTDGEGMMTARAPYATHIKLAKDTKEVSLFFVPANQPTTISIRKIPVNHWKAAFGRFWMRTWDRGSKTSQASRCMHVLVMVATVHQAVLILSRVNNRSASTIQYRRLGKPLTASEFAGCWRSMTLSVNTTSRWASILQPATVIFHFPRLTLKRLSACFMSMATRILVSSDLQPASLKGQGWWTEKFWRHSGAL